MACARALPRLARGFYVCPKSHPAPGPTCHKISVAFPPKLTLVATPMRVFFSSFFWMVRGVVVEGSLCVIVRRAFIHGAVQMEREFSTAEFWVRRDATAIRRWGDRNGRASGACPKIPRTVFIGTGQHSAGRIQTDEFNGRCACRQAGDTAE